MNLSGSSLSGMSKDVWWSAERILDRTPLSFDSSRAKSFLSGRRVLVTGAAGSIGQAVSRHLASLDLESLILFDHNESALAWLVDELDHQGSATKVRPSLFLGDITIDRCVRSLFETTRPEYVIHAAAYKHLPILENHEDEAMRVNLEGANAIADAAEKFHSLGLVLLSTDKAVEPSSVLGHSKAAAERSLLFRDSETQISAVRFGNVYGSRGSVVEKFVQQIERRQSLTLTDPAMARYFMTVDESAGFILEAMMRGEGGDLFVPKFSESTLILDLANRLVRAAGLTLDKDLSIKTIGRRPGEKLEESLYGPNESPLSTDHPQISRIRVR